MEILDRSEISAFPNARNDVLSEPVEDFDAA